MEWDSNSIGVERVNYYLTAINIQLPTFPLLPLTWGTEDIDSRGGHILILMTTMEEEQEEQEEYFDTLEVVVLEGVIHLQIFVVTPIFKATSISHCLCWEVNTSMRIGVSHHLDLGLIDMMV